MISFSLEDTAIFFTYIFTLLAVNTLILLTFKNSRDLRHKLHQRQESLYTDLQLERYFDKSAIENYRKRYSFWFTLDIVLGGMVLIVAFILKSSQ
ncbi:MAG: hypothetical protein ISR65_19255 [Bacteriovoracaceae bacterium]|nr:hypothetical protein [Bacteriovoracaceae bacterium]